MANGTYNNPRAGSNGSRRRMEKLSKKYTVTSGTTEEGDEITYLDKDKKRGKDKAIRLEKSADNTYYKTSAKTRGRLMRGTTSDEAMEKAKKEVTQKKYERTKKRIEKKSTKGATTKNLRGSVEAKAAKEESRYQRFAAAAKEYESGGNVIDDTKSKNLNKEDLARYRKENK